MSDDKKDSCEARIRQHMESRLAQFLPDLDDVETCIDIINERGHAGQVEEIRTENTDEDGLSEGAFEEDIKRDAQELHYDHINDDVLCIDKVTTYKVVISTGGPGDQFEFDFDEDGDLVEGRYRFLDWFDGASRKLDNDDAERLLELFGIDPKNER